MKNLIFLVTIFAVATFSSAQPVFEQQTGILNPFNGITVGAYIAPAFADINNDGLQDVFFGVSTGRILFYKNTGTTNQPVFEQQTGEDNPLGIVNAIAYSSLAFVDIDGDGDLDAFIGSVWAIIQFYENIGDASNPVFVRRFNEQNPLVHYEVGWEAKMNFVDIDGDGDFDVFIGDDYGVVRFYLNAGSSTSPLFVEQTGTMNPLTGIYVGDFVTPTFADVDNDGDFDLLLGEDSGALHYFENTGTAYEPHFVQQTGVQNPFNGIDLGTESKPAFVDIDNDGDADVFVGNEDGQVFYFKNMIIQTGLESNYENRLSVFPNPTNGILEFNLGCEQVATISIFDNSGRLKMFHKDRTENTLNQLCISQLSSGIYILRVETKNSVYQEKIVKL
ncbi:MAG: T9SS type A sorting domain-containing protein [Bacteroidales bacterium]|nr:T9SS type A sorting domain-containing protein [Bacteroidales bacterium]